MDLMERGEMLAFPLPLFYNKSQRFYKERRQRKL